MIPSLLQIPSAVSDSKLHSVLPNNGKGDFQFERSTGATRINRDGLIEEVGYFSSELVQNGDFSELGSELVTNGDFATNSDWTFQGSTVFINDGKLVFQNTLTNTEYAQQSITAPTGKTYKITFTVSDLSIGDSIKVRYPFQDTSVDSNGTHTLFAVGTTANFIRFTPNSSTGTFKIDNVSVKQVDPNDRWTLGTGWSYGENKAISDSTVAFQSLTQSAAISNSNGKTFKVKFTISDYQSGGVALYISGFINNSFFIFANGDYDYNLTVSSGTSGNVEFLTHSGGFKGVISNVSIVEVQGDRPRLSYDITNGVVEDKPHLLLEPSSTNLVTFSKDFSQWSSLGSPSPTITTNFAISPDGTQNASRYVVNSSSASTRLELGAITVSAASYTFSLYIKNNTGNNSVKLNVYDGSDNNQTFTATDTWQRISYTLTTSATSSCFLSIRTSGDADFLIYGAQFEQQAFATSFIPTAGTTITRAAESSYLHNIDNGVLNQSGFTLFLDTNLLNDTVNNFRDIIALYNTAGSITMRLETRTNGQVYIQQTGVVSSGDNFNSATFGSNSVNFEKFAISCSTSEVQLWADGNKINDYSGSYVFTFDKLGFRGNDSVVETILKHKGVAVYNEALTDAQLIELTS